MYSIKDKIRNNIVSPTLEDRVEKILVGKIISANEYTNLCHIKYKDFNGNFAQANNVEVIISTPNLIGWFPEEKDIVVIEQQRDKLFIIGPYIENYALHVRDKLQLNSDIYPESAGDTFSGYIL